MHLMLGIIWGSVYPIPFIACSMSNPVLYRTIVQLDVDGALCDHTALSDQCR